MFRWWSLEMFCGNEQVPVEGCSLFRAKFGSVCIESCWRQQLYVFHSESSWDKERKRFVVELNWSFFGGGQAKRAEFAQWVSRVITEAAQREQKNVQTRTEKKEKFIERINLSFCLHFRGNFVFDGGILCNGNSSGFMEISEPQGNRKKPFVLVWVSSQVWG